MSSPNIHIYAPRYRHHDAMLLVPDGKVIRMFNLSHFKPKPIPPFPVTVPGDSRQNDQDGLGVNDDDSLADTVAESLTLTDRDPEDDEEEEREPPPLVYPIEKPVRKLFDELNCWTISTQRANDVHERLPDVDRCEMVWDGKAIIGIGSKGVFYQWSLKQD
jgi:hypothetical protein